MAVGFSGLLLAVLWALAGAFAVDWWLEMPVLLRVISLLAVAGVGAWAFVEFVRPMLGWKEDQVDLALIVQKHHRIDSDLVAALQFEGPQAAAWGSPQLETAVIHRVADSGNRLDVFEGLDYGQCMRRLGALAATVILAAVLVILFPNHVSAFFNRFFLGKRHYPTQTQLEAIVINGQIVHPGEGTATIPHGQPLEFAVFAWHSDGLEELPESGRVKIWSLETKAESELELTPLLNDASAAAHLAVLAAADSSIEIPTDHRVFIASLKQASESLGYQVYLGDAWTDPAEIRVVPPPAVDMYLEVTPPAYTLAANTTNGSKGGARQVSVIEGSSVAVRLTSNKPLREAALTLGDSKLSLQPAGEDDEDRQVWRYEDPAGPLSGIAAAVKFKAQVVDEDGMSLAQPLEGVIKLKPDQSPKVFADVTTRVVLPTAKPSIAFGASDDFGLATLGVNVFLDGREGALGQPIELPLSGTPRRVSTLLAQLDADPSSAELDKGRIPPALAAELAANGVTLSANAAVSIVLPGDRWRITDVAGGPAAGSANSPVRNQQFEIRNKQRRLHVFRLFQLDLSQFDLQAGDRVRIELSATDFRGDKPGKPAVSQPILLNVTDKAGLLASQTEPDRRSAEQLDAIIQLGIGDSR